MFTHVTQKIIIVLFEKKKKNNIEKILCLPPYSTYLSCLCDLNIFSHASNPSHPPNMITRML